MKKRILTLLLSGTLAVSLFSGCGKGETNAREELEPSYYTSEEELPNDAYYIEKKVKTEDGKETRYYPLLAAENTCPDVRSGIAGFDDSRIQWVNYNTDDQLIPTMTDEDKLIYKSATLIPTAYSLEKFFDNEYTFGVSGLKADTSGNCKYDADDGGAILSTSSAAGFASLSEVDSVYLVSCKENASTDTDKKTESKKKTNAVRVTADTLSDSGTVKNLKLMHSYECDIRTGTEKVPATLVCDTHYFSSAETYRFGSFDFITEHIARLNVPEYVSTGYYTIGSESGAGGFFRYVKGSKNYKKLEASDYNKTIYLYDEYGSVGGTTTGLVFDPDTGFLVGNEDLSDSYDGTTATTQLYTYKEYKGKASGEYVEEVTNPETEITNKTSLDPIEGNTYMGTFTISSITKNTISSNKRLYEFVATEANSNDTLTFRYFGKTGDNAVVPSVGGTYTIQFTPVSGFDGYLISYMEMISEGTAPAEGTPQADDPESEDTATVDNTAETTTQE